MKTLDRWKNELTLKIPGNRCSACRLPFPRDQIDIRFREELVVCQGCVRIEQELIAATNVAKLIREWIGNDDDRKAIAVMCQLGARLDALVKQFEDIDLAGFDKFRDLIQDVMRSGGMDGKAPLYAERMLFESLQQFPRFDAAKADKQVKAFVKKWS